jgi:hypothetical protein
VYLKISSNISRTVYSVVLEVLIVVITLDSRISTFRGVLNLVLRAIILVLG